MLSILLALAATPATAQVRARATILSPVRVSRGVVTSPPQAPATVRIARDPATGARLLVADFQ